MHEVKFKVEPEKLGWGVEDVVNIYIDGVRLQELVRPVELPFAKSDGHPELAGGYAGLLAESLILWPSRHFLGEPEMAVDGRAWLLGCVCGVPGCQTLAARIDVNQETVTWSDWHGRWNLAELDSMVFNRKQYEDALHGGVTDTRRMLAGSDLPESRATDYLSAPDQHKRRH